MNKNTKIILSITGGLIGLCLLTFVAGIFIIRSAGALLAVRLQTDPVKVKPSTSSMADYTLPAGFGSPYSIHLAGFSMVQYNHTDGHSHITFIQIPNGIRFDLAEIERQFRQDIPKEESSGEDAITVVEQKQGMIDEQPVTLVFSEGINSDKEPFREVSALFEGKGGQTLVVYEAPVSRWDQAEVDTFLTSIH